MDFPFVYFGANFSQLTVSTNGFVFFSSPVSTCCRINRPTSSNVIAAYNYDLTTDEANSGAVFYRSLNTSSSSSDLLRIQNEINTLVQRANFIARSAFIVTYDRVQSYYNRSEVATFQIILSSDLQRSSYVTISYESCLTHTPSVQLKSELDCLNSRLDGVYEKFILNPCGSSNVNVSGKWIFDVSNECI